MYSLTLTKEERKAIDWVGDRYANGNGLYSALYLSDTSPEIEWDSDQDITFALPEWSAWEIKCIAEEDNYSWPCFAPNLANKLTTFVEAIV